jgi:hypothetical protein
VLVTVALFVTVEPVVALLLTRTTRSNVADAPADSVAIEHVTLPVPPAGGVEQIKVGPLV